MTLWRSLPCLLAATLAAGCAQPLPPRGGDAPSPPTVAGCDAAGAQFAVGQQATDSLMQEAQRRAGAARVRLLRPGQVVTMEFDGARLNLDVDAAGRVLRARCG